MLPGSIYLDTWGVLGYQVVYTQIPGGYLPTRQYIPIYAGVLGYQVVYIPRYLGVLGCKVVYIPRYLESTWLPGSTYPDTRWGNLATRQYIPINDTWGVLGQQVAYTWIYLATIAEYIPRYRAGTCLPGSIYIPRYLGGTFLPGSIYLDSWGVAFHEVYTYIPGGTCFLSFYLYEKFFFFPSSLYSFSSCKVSHLKLKVTVLINFLSSTYS